MGLFCQKPQGFSDKGRYQVSNPVWTGFDLYTKPQSPIWVRRCGNKGIIIRTSGSSKEEGSKLIPDKLCVWFHGGWWAGSSGRNIIFWGGGLSTFAFLSLARLPKWPRNNKGGPVNNAIRFFAGPGCNECDDRLVTGGHVLQFVVGTIF